MRAEYVCIINGLCNVHNDTILYDRAHFLIAMYGRLVGSADQTTLLQLFYVSCKGAIADIQFVRKLIHAHLIVFQQNLQNLKPDFGPQSLEGVKTFVE